MEKRINCKPLSCKFVFRDEGSKIVCDVTTDGKQQTYTCCVAGNVDGLELIFREETFNWDCHKWFRQFRDKIMKRKVREEVFD